MVQVQAIADGRILVGGQKVDPTFCLKDSQTMTHFVHRWQVVTHSNVKMKRIKIEMKIRINN